MRTVRTKGLVCSQQFQVDQPLPDLHVERDALALVLAVVWLLLAALWARARVVGHATLRCCPGRALAGWLAAHAARCGEVVTGDRKSVV